MRGREIIVSEENVGGLAAAQEMQVLYPKSYNAVPADPKVVLIDSDVVVAS
jgi:hypothetical protein